MIWHINDRVFHARPFFDEFRHDAPLTYGVGRVIMQPSFRREGKTAMLRRTVYAFAYRFYFYFYFRVRAICDVREREALQGV